MKPKSSFEVTCCQVREFCTWSCDSYGFILRLFRESFYRGGAFRSRKLFRRTRPHVRPVYWAFAPAIYTRSSFCRVVFKSRAFNPSDTTKNNVHGCAFRNILAHNMNLWKMGLFLFFRIAERCFFLNTDNTLALKKLEYNNEIWRFVFFFIISPFLKGDFYIMKLSDSAAVRKYARKNYNLFLIVFHSPWKMRSPLEISSIISLT